MSKLTHDLIGKKVYTTFRGFVEIAVVTNVHIENNFAVLLIDNETRNVIDAYIFPTREDILVECEKQIASWQGTMNIIRLGSPSLKLPS